MSSGMDIWGKVTQGANFVQILVNLGLFGYAAALMASTRFYADHNATTPISEGVWERIQLSRKLWANPSSIHEPGRKAHEFMEESRSWVAQAVGLSPTQVVFTSGGSEANTLALWGSELQNKDFRLLTMGIEHSSLLDTAKHLAKKGSQVAYLATDRDGQIDLEKLEDELDLFHPSLVSLMAANNETGALYPIPEIAKLCEKRGVLFHTDAVQALGKIPAAHFNSANMISISAHKIYGPKGIGALLVGKGLSLHATHFGGSQEIKRRGGAQNTLGIAGFGAACREIDLGKAESLSRLRDRFEERLLSRLETRIFCRGFSRLPNTSLIRFPGISADVLLSALDLAGVSASAGSACSSGSISPSHVLLAMGYPREEAKEGLRFSWGTETTEEIVDSVADTLIEIVQRIQERRRSC